MASYTNPSDVLSDIRRSTVFTPLANFAASIRSITDATRAIKRIETSEINDSILSFVKKSDELKRASRIIRANPGVFESRSQAIAWSNKARSISMDAGGNRLSAFQRQFGHTAGTSLFNQENAQLFTNRMAEIGRSPRQQRIFDYYQQFGGAASADAMDRAEDVVRAEDERKRSEDRLEGRRAFAYDTADDYTRMRHDLRGKYKSSALADAKIRQDTLKRLPNWMKNLVSNSRLSTKFLFNMSKGLGHAKKIPFLGKMVSDPVTAGVALGMGSIALMQTTSQRGDEANKRWVEQQNRRSVFGNVSQRFAKAALLAGVTDPTKIQDMWGNLFQYGNPEVFMSGMAEKVKGLKPGIERTLFMQSIGLDPTMMNMLDTYSGLQKATPERQMLGNLTRAKMAQDQMTKTGSGFWDTIVGNFSSASVGARFIGRESKYAIDNPWAFGAYGYLWNLFVNHAFPGDDPYYKLKSAVDSQDSYQREYSTGASNGTGGEKTITVNVNTGDVVLPNAQNGNDVIKGIINYSADKSDCEAVLHMFDSKTE